MQEVHYFIDGYNLMFRVLRAGSDLQKQRELIIRDLYQKVKITGLNVTLVFDAQHQKGESSRSQISNLEILFTKQGETADEFILSYLKHDKNPQKQIVVTSDKKLAWLSRRRGARTETVEDFLKMLNQRHKNKIKRKQTNTTIPILPKPKKPSEKQEETVPQESEYDYYLKQFESRFDEWVQTQPIKESSEPKKRKKKKIQEAPKEKDGLSNMERWRRAFERNLDEEEHKN